MKILLCFLRKTKEEWSEKKEKKKMQALECKSFQIWRVYVSTSVVFSLHHSIAEKKIAALFERDTQYKCNLTEKREY